MAAPADAGEMARVSSSLHCSDIKVILRWYSASGDDDDNYDNILASCGALFPELPV